MIIALLAAAAWGRTRIVYPLRAKEVAILYRVVSTRPERATEAQSIARSRTNAEV